MDADSLCRSFPSAALLATTAPCSYLTVHNDSRMSQRKEILPAGRGMKDVQLLILTAEMKLCGVGEMGEIYTRSPHMAAGYLGLPEATREKFIQNPFNPNDPVDRMYKTGDIGRYLPDGIGASLWRGAALQRLGFTGRFIMAGAASLCMACVGIAKRLCCRLHTATYLSAAMDCFRLLSAHALAHPFSTGSFFFSLGVLCFAVECAGRADDQVKIRGFRIELGEIDTHLSQHPDVRENVTVVRRDIYEEHVIVSYFVPTSDSFDVTKIRQHLRDKLPVYAVPARAFTPPPFSPLAPLFVSAAYSRGEQSLCPSS